jgi:hypothetical protein
LIGRRRKQLVCARCGQAIAEGELVEIWASPFGRKRRYHRACSKDALVDRFNEIAERQDAKGR